MDEFAMGSTTETSAYGVTKIPGIQSMFRAVLPAVQAAPLQQRNASICTWLRYRRIHPSASLLLRCGRMKPTYGTVSRYGLIAYGSSLDQIGPLCKDVTDCATILEAIASHDDKDSTSMKREDTDFTSALVDDVKGMQIGIPRDYFGEGLDPEVKEAVLAAAKT